MSLAVGQRPSPAGREPSPAKAARAWLWRCPTPTRIGQLVALVAVAVIVLAGLLLVRIAAAQSGSSLIGQRAGPEVTAASDLYFALNDMDAQVANVLLVGDTTRHGITRAQSLQLYEQRRIQADRAVRTAAAAADDPTTSRAVDEILDALGEYEARAARTQQLDQQHPHPVARPDAAALAEYRQATDLSRTRLLPAARQLADGQASRLQAHYAALHGQLLSTRTAVIWIGLAGVTVLVGLQIYLARRFRRLLTPALAVATLVTALGVVLAAGLLGDEAEQLRVATKDAFDSLYALRAARAISYDANADEGRYLLDPARSDRYQQAFLTKSQQLVQLPGAGLETWDAKLAAALDAYRHDRRDVRWGGFLGAEFRNITFPGERDTAERALTRYQSYQLDDRRIRAMAGGGHLEDAVTLCTDYTPGGSNYAFDQYDQAMSDLIGINQRAFDQAIRTGAGRLRGWTAGVWLGGTTVLLLLGAGTHRRIREYSPARRT